MIRLLCYEPAGQVIRLSAEDLTRHVLGLGATGCGKTTGLINPLLQQTIAWRAGDVERKIGLLVLDPKEDDTQDKVRLYAREAGRSDDLVVLSDSGDAYYDYFAGFRRLDQVDEFTRRVLYGSKDMGDQNAYWTESRFGLLNSALTVLLASGNPLSFDRVAEFLRNWLYSPDATEIKQSLEFAERLLSVGNLRPETRRSLQLALAEAQNWKAIDVRTRELIKSTLNNALRSLLSPAARDLFNESRARRFNPADVLAGKILVASLNAVSHPHLASMLFKVLKRDYYEAVLSRIRAYPERDRLCGLILDELPLSVEPGDATALALLRSKGGFVVACAQGLNGLDSALGVRHRSALLANFNSIFYFSSREDQTDEHAMLALGVDEQHESSAESKDAGELQVLEGKQSPQVRLVCPPGSLARLSQHHAYAKLANGSVTKTPVWLEPKFHEFIPSPVQAQTDDLAEAVAFLKSQDEDEAKLHAGVPLLLVHMHRRRHPLRLTPNVVAASWQLCKPRVARNRLRTGLPQRIEGLDELPSCWLLGLTHWLRRNPALTHTLSSVSLRSGVLWPELDSSSKLWGDGPLTVPEAINLFIYPSLWRPLLPRHFAQLAVERPDLKPELQSLPQVCQQSG